MMPTRPALRSQAERDKLTTAHMGLVGAVVKRMAPRDVHQIGGWDDAFQLGCIGLLRAAELWDASRLSPTTGKPTKFSTYAYWAIWGYLHHSLPRQLMLRLPGREWLARRKTANVPRVAALSDTEAKEGAVGKVHEMETPAGPDPALIADVRDAMGKLCPLDRQSLRERFWEGLGLTEIGKRHGITKAGASCRVLTAKRRLASKLKGGAA